MPTTDDPKVWIVLRRYDYEGDALESIWATRARAVTAAAAIAAVHEYRQVSEGVDEWTNASASASILIEEWPVQS